jgi:5-deoxy-glucuronate isomerase
MSRLLSRWQQPNAEGCTQSVTPERAGWGHVGFDVYELEEGQALTLPAVGEERCLVLVAGRAAISTPTAQFSDIGERMSPFERIKPWAVYVTPNEAVQVKALTKLELAVCSAPGKGTYPTRLIAPQDIGGEARGKGHNQRYVHNILPEDKPADSLLVVEVWTNEGCTSSYPSHKHDTDNPPHETYLRRRITIASTRSRGFVCNGFIPTIGRLMSAWRSITVTWSWCRRAITRWRRWPGMTATI